MEMKCKAVRLILDEALTFDFLPRRKGELKLFDNHRNDHAQLHHRQRFPCTVICAIREWNECIFAKHKLRLGGPTFGNKLVWSNKCTRVCNVSAECIVQQNATYLDEAHKLELKQPYCQECSGRRWLRLLVVSPVADLQALEDGA